MWKKKERNKYNRLVYSHLLGFTYNCPPFPGSCAMFPKLGACLCMALEHKFVVVSSYFCPQHFLGSLSMFCTASILTASMYLF